MASVRDYTLFWFPDLDAFWRVGPDARANKRILDKHPDAIIVTNEDEVLRAALDCLNRTPHTSRVIFKDPDGQS